MADKREAPVEKYKLTKEQLDFQKRFKQLQKVRALLQLGTLDVMQRMETMQDLWKSLNLEAQMLQPPEKPINELPGMNFKDEDFERLRINY